MKVTTEKLEGCELVVVSGMLDSATAPALEKALLGLIAAHRNRLVVNLSAVEFMSSIGLKALLAAVMEARRQSPPGDVVISGAGTQLMDVFQRVGMTYLFRFYDDNRSAANALTGG